MSPMPKIVHIIHSGAIGGGPRVLMDLATHTPYQHVVVAPDDGPLLTEASRAGLETSRLQYAGKYSFVGSIKFIRRLVAGSDIVHLHGQFAGAYGAPATSGLPCRVVYTAHFPSFVTDSNWHNRARNRAAEMSACRFSDVVITCCNTMRLEYISRHLVPCATVRTVYNGVRKDAGKMNGRDLRAELSIPPEAPVILAVGRFTDQKGFDTLVASFPNVISAQGDAVLVLVGDGPERLPLDRLARSLGMSNYIRFTGFVDDPAQYYRLASVVVVPSRYDIFPLVPLEAMMHGKPVIASDLPVLAEAIQDGVTGLLVPKTPRAMANALMTMLAHPDRAGVMGKRGRDRAHAHFTVERMARDYERVYNDLLLGRQ